jgi:hypothetical protein
VTGLPALVLAGRGTIRIVDGGGGDRSLPVPDVELAYAVDDTRLVAQISDPAVPTLRDLFVVDGSGVHNLVTGGEHGAVLYDLAEREGQAGVLAGTLPSGEGEPAGDLLFVALDGSGSVRIDAAFAPEYGVSRASAVGETTVASATSDLTESFTFYDVTGTVLDVPGNPATTLPYAQPPFLTQAVLAPEGDRYAYLSGPDSDVENPNDPPVGTWELRVRSMGSTTDDVVLEIAGTEDVLGWFDYDGRFAVASFVGLVERVVVVDTLDEVAEPHTLCSVTGAATIKDG